MKKENHDFFKLLKDRHILIAVDESLYSQWSVFYVADFLCSIPTYKVTLLSIITIADEDFFDSEDEWARWMNTRRVELNELLGRYREMLIQSGALADNVMTKVVVKNQPVTIADTIIEEQQNLGCCTVVIAKREKTMQEEFLFGSTSSELLHKGKNFTLWIIE